MAPRRLWCAPLSAQPGLLELAASTARGLRNTMQGPPARRMRLNSSSARWRVTGADKAAGLDASGLASPAERQPCRTVDAKFVASLLLTPPSHAQSPNDPAIEACRTTGLMALKERSPSLFDMESLAVSKANTTIEDIPVRTVIMGEAYLERKETGQIPTLRLPDRFVCPIGEKGTVLLTFFTAQ